MHVQAGMAELQGVQRQVPELLAKKLIELLPSPSEAPFPVCGLEDSASQHGLRLQSS